MRRSAATLAVLGVLSGCGGATAPVPVQSVLVTPALLPLVLGITPSGTLTATARDASGNPLAGRTATWESLTPAVATVSPAGRVTAVAPGTATIRATVDGVSGSATVEVIEAPVASVTVSLGTGLMELGEAVTATATVRDAVGRVLQDRAVEWLSEDPLVASVTPAGLVTAVAAGSTMIVARSEGVSGSAQVRVFDQPPNLTLDGLHVTQAVQRFVGGVPLVAGGHPGLLNVFGTLDRPFRAGTPTPVVRVAVYNGPNEVLVDERPMSRIPGPVVDPLVPVHQIVVPAAVLEPGLRVVATVNPAGVPVEASDADNSWPRSGEPAEVEVRAVLPLEAHFVPIHLSNGGSVGTVSGGTIPEYLYATRQMHPVAAISVTIGGTMTTDVAFGDGQAAAWLAILAELDLVRVAEGTSRYYIGALRPPPGVSFVQFGGFAYVPGNPASAGPGTRTAVVVGVGWFNRQRQTTELVAHELGHTMGRRHAPCGGAANPDAQYPYGNAASDIMSYCTPAWISDYNYEALLAARLAGGAVARAATGELCDCLIVRGEVERGRPRLLPAFTMSTRPAVSERTGSYTLVGERVDGSRVFAFTFDPVEIDHAPSTRHFTFAIPLAAAEREALARLRVTGPGGSSELVAPAPDEAAAAAAPAAALVTAAPAAAAGLELRWNAERHPAVLVRDPATGRIVALGRSGRLLLPAPDGELEVLLSDGLRTVGQRVSRAGRVDG